jgi:hypothetical protein
MKFLKGGVIVSLLAALLVGCAGVPVEMTSVKGSDYEVLGEGEGSATGIMLFNFIPIGQNQRFQKAYNAAVASKGGDYLLNPEISERWFWAYILNGYTTTVRGTVVKAK